MFQCTHLNDAGNAGCPKKVQEEFLFFHYTEHWTLHTEHWTLRCASKQTRLSLSMFALVLTSRSVDFDVDNYVDKEKLLSWWCLSGPMFSAWLTPPIVPHLSVYVFNITNPEEVGRHYLHHHHHHQHDNHKKNRRGKKLSTILKCIQDDANHYISQLYRTARLSVDAKVKPRHLSEFPPQLEWLQAPESFRCKSFLLSFGDNNCTPLSRRQQKIAQFFLLLLNSFCFNWGRARFS